MGDGLLRVGSSPEGCGLFFPVARRDRRRADVRNGVEFELEVAIGTKTDTGSLLGGVGVVGIMFGVSGYFSGQPYLPFQIGTRTTG